MSVIVASTRQAPADVVDPRIKSLNYLNRLLARLEAVRAGADEAFMLNAAGTLAEGTTDNVFLVRDGVLLTPPASDGALEGITREAVLALARELGIPAREASLGTYDLRAAEEAFLVGTGAGLVAIRSIDGRAVPVCPGPDLRADPRGVRRARAPRDGRLSPRTSPPRPRRVLTGRASARGLSLLRATMSIAARSSSGVLREKAMRAPWAAAICADGGAKRTRLSGTKRTPRSRARRASARVSRLAPVGPERQPAVRKAARDVTPVVARAFDGGDGVLASGHVLGARGVMHHGHGRHAPRSWPSCTTAMGVRHHGHGRQARRRWWSRTTAMGVIHHGDGGHAPRPWATRTTTRGVTHHDQGRDAPRPWASRTTTVGVTRHDHERRARGAWAATLVDHGRRRPRRGGSRKPAVARMEQVRWLSASLPEPARSRDDGRRSPGPIRPPVIAARSDDAMPGWRARRPLGISTDGGIQQAQHLVQ